MNDEQKPTYLEFEDPDDHESHAHESAEQKTSFRITVQPEMYLAAMVENPKELSPDVFPVVRQLMYASYLQGKRVGDEAARRRLEESI